MTTYDLFGSFDPARILGFGKNYVDQNRQAGAKIVRTYDSYQDIVRFLYPDLRANTTECRDAYDDAMRALHGDKLAVYRGQIDIKTDGDCFEIILSRWNFEQIFATELSLKLHQPGNIVSKYAPLAAGKGQVTAYVTPSKTTVTLLYENIYTSESKEYTVKTLREKLPSPARENVVFSEHNQSLAITLPVRMYESLTGHRVPIIEQKDKNQF